VNSSVCFALTGKRAPCRPGLGYLMMLRVSCLFSPCYLILLRWLPLWLPFSGSSKPPLLKPPSSLHSARRFFGCKSGRTTREEARSSAIKDNKKATPTHIMVMHASPHSLAQLSPALFYNPLPARRLARAPPSSRTARACGRPACTSSNRSSTSRAPIASTHPLLPSSSRLPLCPLDRVATSCVFSLKARVGQTSSNDMRSATPSWLSYIPCWFLHSGPDNFGFRLHAAAPLYQACPCRAGQATARAARPRAQPRLSGRWPERGGRNQRRGERVREGREGGKSQQRGEIRRTPERHACAAS